jgi:hypothetical protein
VAQEAAAAWLAGPYSAALAEFLRIEAIVDGLAAELTDRRDCNAAVGAGVAVREMIRATRAGQSKSSPIAGRAGVCSMHCPMIGMHT